MRKEIRKLFMVTILLVSLAVTGCGSNKETTKESNENATQDSTEIVTKVVEKEESATVEEKEDGTIKITTDTGEEIEIASGSSEVKEEADGSKTYTTSDGKKVTVSSDGSATVTTKEVVEAETGKPVNTSDNNTSNGGASNSNGSSNNSTSSSAGGSNNSGNSSSSSTEKTETTCSHSWKSATCTAPKTCTKCGATEGTAKGHTSSDWTVTKEATETTEGTKVKTCTVCGTTLETASIAKVAHNHNYVWTYVSDGDYKVNKCSCGQETGERAYNLGNGVYGQWKDSMASDLMYWTNMQRGNTVTTPVDEIGNYLPSVISQPLSNTLSSQAKTRALQCVFDYGHNGMITTDECLAQGYSDAGSVSSAWMASGDHGPAMCDYRYTQGGTACLWYDSDGNGTMTYIWVLTLEY